MNFIDAVALSFCSVLASRFSFSRFARLLASMVIWCFDYEVSGLLGLGLGPRSG